MNEDFEMDGRIDSRDSCDEVHESRDRMEVVVLSDVVWGEVSMG